MAETKKMAVGGLLIAVGILLPQVFHLAGGSAMGTLFLPMHLPVLLGAGGVGVHIQLPPGCRSRRAGYSAYLDAATGRDGPAVSLRGVQRPAARDSRGHYNGYILRLQSHCGKPAAVLV